MQTRIFIAMILAGALLLGLSSCTKGDTASNPTVSVRLTDAPANYQQVLIDIQSAQICYSPDGITSNWVSLPIRAGVYNLLDFRNGMDTLIAQTEMMPGRITQMRLILGINNQVKVNGQFYTLDTPSAMQSGLKFNIDTTLTEGMNYRLWIDFDAARSIVAKGNGGFNLKPVIRTFTQATSEAIKGVVSPVAALPAVTAIANGDTIGTMAGSDGKFLFRGIAAGTYKVVFSPVLPYTIKTVDNVTVTTGLMTDMGTVTLQ